MTSVSLLLAPTLIVLLHPLRADYMNLWTGLEQGYIFYMLWIWGPCSRETERTLWALLPMVELKFKK